MYSAALRSLFARRRRAALTSLAVLLGVAMVAGTFVFTDTIHRAFRQLFTAESRGAEVIVSSPQGPYSATDPPANMSAALASRIGRLPGVAAAQGQVSGEAAVIAKNGQIVKSTGAPTLAISYLPAPFTGLQFIAGNRPAGPGEVALDHETAARAGYRIGDLVPIVTGQPVKRFRLTGLVGTDGASIAGSTLAVFDPATAQALYDKQGLIDAIYVAGNSGASPATLEHEITPLLPAGISAQSTAQAVESDAAQVADQLEILTGGLLAFGFIVVFVSAFVITGTLSITVAGRTRELALLRALGASRRQVFTAVIMEAGIVGTLSSVGGLALGLVIALAIRAVLKLAGADVPSTSLVIEPRTLAVGLGVGVLVTIAAGLVPAFRATRVSPVEALRDSATGGARPRARPPSAAVAAAALFAVAGIALVLVHQGSANARLTTSTAGAILLVAAAVLLTPSLVPWLSRIVAWPLERGGRILGRLARENVIRTPARTAITASSLMIGLALVLFVSVYIGGARSSAKRAIGRTFIADFAIGSRDGTSSIPSAAAQAVASVPNLEAVSSVKTANATIAGTTGVTAAGFDPTTFGQVYRFDWTRGSGPSLEDLGNGDVLVEQDTARAAHLHVGEQVEVTTPAGLTAGLTVRGIYADRALLRGFALPLSEFDQLFNQDRLQEVFVKLAPGASRAQAAAVLQQGLSTLPGVVARSGPQLQNEAASRVNDVLVLFYALLAMSALMALLGILTALSLSIHERTRELGLLRTLGMTRQQARALIRDESLVTAAIGTLVGVVLGLAIAWIVTRALASEGIAFAVPWPQLGLLVLVGLLVGVLAALPAAARAARLDVLTAIAHE
jgi:putative ABC transport system permease protein